MSNSHNNSSKNSPANRHRQQAPHKKSVYLRRRIIALVVLAVAVALIWSLIAAAVGWVQGLFGGSSGVNPAGGAVAGEACDPGSILLEPIVANSSGSEQAAFDTGINPFFGYRITNIGEKDCSFDVGAKDTYLKVTSGSETIWTSADCDRTALISTVVTLKPNEALSSPLSDWYRVRSSSTGCGAEQKPVIAGGASYHLNVEVGGVSSKETSQFILN